MHRAATQKLPRGRLLPEVLPVRPGDQPDTSVLLAVETLLDNELDLVPVSSACSRPMYARSVAIREDEPVVSELTLVALAQTGGVRVVEDDDRVAVSDPRGRPMQASTI